jgi:hypothetical protein
MWRSLVHSVLAFTLACGSTETARRDVQAPGAAHDAAYQRAVAFAGTPIRIAGRGPSRATITLPTGLSLDPATGTIAGVAATPGETILRIPDERGERVVSLAILPAAKSGDRFVSTSGDDASAGTADKPFRTITRALTGIAAGSTVFVHGGKYAEDVSLQDVQGTAGQPIVIRSHPGERAAIVGKQAQVTWERASGPEAAPDEWISRETFERERDESTSRGAFLDREPFTRLLTYSRLEDLRATNQRWVAGDDSLPGTTTKKGKRLAWVYFGPGIWHDPESGRVHLRLSPTTNRVAGVSDYDGPTDPSRAAIALWARSSTPLLIARSSNLELRDLTILGGGDESVTIRKSEQILLDHVDIGAATMGLVVGGSTGVRFRHGRIEGGIPPWSFRSDFKANYKLAQADGTSKENNLVRKTSRALVYIGDGVRELELSYCELENAHDIYIAGVRSAVHHCRVHNIHDEALFVSHVKDIDDLRIHDNVFERVLSAVSGVGRKSTGARYVYRNIFDLREPTAGYRPGASPRDLTLRWGHLFKGPISSAPFFFYQNTVLARSQAKGKPALLHFDALDDTRIHPNWFLNNVVVVTGRDAGPVSFLPDPDLSTHLDPAGRPMLRSDGNVWVREDGTDAPLFRCRSGQRRVDCATKRWRALSDVRDATGFEKRSHWTAKHGFVRMRSLEEASDADDLRPTPGSPAVKGAIELPKELPDSVTAPGDAGALPANSPPHYIGIDGRWRY